ncbi:DUF397 domain-containing protein [Saccharothrix obliqua]|uniref:DUF397 domain-containing protein n=1 Tax=Saccharothrix obliqua TaxID=2861747 RepID=UPI001C5FF4E9|nr:DUF397 domain-containing protein [Saccharothrix obliqua]MBW4719430.1 DUF397 domain-containing protein [Saccharothrix obliqua]
MPAPEFPTARWRKASYTEGNDNCVEVAHVTRGVAVRDSKNPDGPVLTFSPNGFAGLLNHLRSHA